MFQPKELLEIQTNLHRFALRLTHNQTEADDLLQSTLLRALEKKHLFQEGTSLFSWTSKVMYNLFVSQYRTKVKFESQYDPEPIIDRMTIAPTQEGSCELATVRRAMLQLSEEHRTILGLVCIRELGYKEAADLLDVPVGTIRSRLSRARKALQGILETTEPVSTWKDRARQQQQALRAA